MFGSPGMKEESIIPKVFLKHLQINTTKYNFTLELHDKYVS
jgi:hypothetical protein